MIPTIYKKSSINLSSEIPDSLRLVIKQIHSYHYAELYEKKEINMIDLESALITVFDAIEKEKEGLDLKFCYFCMAIVIGIAVQPTIKAYLPRERITSEVFQCLFQGWLNSDYYYNSEGYLSFQFKKSLEKYQALDEAVDIFEKILQIFNSDQTKPVLLDILDDCLQGYAIFPGSQGRRELFDWWLLDVVPSVFCGQFPENIYTLKEIHKMSKDISKIRKYFWNVVRNNKHPEYINLEKQNLLLGLIANKSQSK